MGNPNQKTTLFPILDLQVFQANNLEGLCILDHSIQGKNIIETPHKHDFFLFFLIEKGKGHHRIDFNSYPVNDRQLHILLPGQVHDWDLDKNTKGFQLMIGKNEFETLGGYLYYSAFLDARFSVLDLREEEFNLLYHEFDQIYQESQKPEPDKDLIQWRCKIAIKLIIREREKNSDHSKRPLIPDLVMQYISLIDKFYKSEKSMSFYADQLHVTSNYLNIICKKSLGQTAYSLIKSRIALESKRLLSISSISVKELAFELGFRDPANFSKFFREETGLSPSDFRKK
ncbi:MAG: AraC family transcriptional regulator [Cyclobacteriaceae bacterium]|nr:AraC family transcriptional regulator [Cyclobacteriaceae bacterium]